MEKWRNSHRDHIFRDQNLLTYVQEITLAENLVLCFGDIRNNYCNNASGIIPGAIVKLELLTLSATVHGKFVAFTK